MDPTSIPPPPPPPPPSATVPFITEPNTHAIPNPASADAVNHNHPSYDEMIYTAIGALKEKEGSSKQAIGKYIEQVYREVIPPTNTHSALLTHHLKRLKTTGHLLMVKKSYKLPRSDSDSSLPPSALQTQRTRGRPPKPKPHPQSFLHQNAQPVWVALGLADDPAPQLNKRGPGRPRKIPLGPVVPVRRGRPPGTGTGRSRLPKRPGRPPKPKSVSAISNGLKRRPGRPPKIQSIPFAASAPSLVSGESAVTAPPTVPTDSVPIGSPRPRGRPRRIAAVLGLIAPAPPLVGAAARGRGRGRGRGVLPMMRQGRPPKLAVVGRSKRPVGRPKGSTAATAAQKVANEDISRKLTYFQSKVKESLGLLKPYFNHESPVTAIAAIQELEILAALDLKAPLRDETQQQQQLPQQPPPQQLPQAQMYQQQYPQIPPQPQLQQLFQPHTSAPS